MLYFISNGIILIIYLVIRFIEEQLKSVTKLMFIVNSELHTVNYVDYI